MRKKSPMELEQNSLVQRQNCTTFLYNLVSAQGGLKTLVRMRQWRVIDADECVHCWQQGETEEHLFFGCGYARSIWSILLSDMGYNRTIGMSMEDELRWVTAAGGGKGVQNDGVKLTFCAYCYWIWRTRNKFFFQT